MKHIKAKFEYINKNEVKITILEQTHMGYAFADDNCTTFTASNGFRLLSICYPNYYKCYKKDLFLIGNMFSFSNKTITIPSILADSFKQAIKEYNEYYKFKPYKEIIGYEDINFQNKYLKVELEYFSEENVRVTVLEQSHRNKEFGDNFDTFYSNVNNMTLGSALYPKYSSNFICLRGSCIAKDNDPTIIPISKIENFKKMVIKYNEYYKFKPYEEIIE